jgi:hypothetical protein
MVMQAWLLVTAISGFLQARLSNWTHGKDRLVLTDRSVSSIEGGLCPRERILVRTTFEAM